MRKELRGSCLPFGAYPTTAQLLRFPSTFAARKRIVSSFIFFFCEFFWEASDFYRKQSKEMVSKLFWAPEIRRDL